MTGKKLFDQRSFFVNRNDDNLTICNNTKGFASLKVFVTPVEVPLKHGWKVSRLHLDCTGNNQQHRRKKMNRMEELQALIDDLAIGDLPAIASLIDRRCDQAMKSFDVADENQRAFEVLDAFGPLEDCQERLEAIARDVAKICAILVDEIDGVPEKK